MSENDALPEYNETSGYPVPSTAEGAEQGESPTPERHEPPPDHPRFNEIYRNLKEEQRDNETLRQELADLRAQPVPEPTYQTPAAQPEDETAWLRDMIREEVTSANKPVVEQFETQKVQMEQARQANAFRAAHPEYDDARDSATLIHTMRKHSLNFELGYRVAFPERVVGQQRQEAPVADVPGVSAHAPAESPEALMARFNDPNCPEAERAMIAMKLTDGGAFGGAAAEKALGF
ncbi:MAG: hypothetical protein DRH30_10085 [Deltaproteobacteria bacterium]|nr:MAG: hypothetical protein DRH30_10085 [Deltaproteobacteria bacterium]